MNIFLPILMLIMVDPITEPAFDVADDVASAIKTGNASNVAKYFSKNVDLKIFDKEDVYSKAQAELILKENFFSKNPAKSFTVIHKSSAKSGDKSIIGTYESSAGKKFRIYYLLKKEAAGYTIQQLRIDTENE